MKELVIHHIPGKGKKRAKVRVSYRPKIGAQPQEREAGFKFTVTEEERGRIRWYLEDYFSYPWGEFRTRAGQVEQLMARLGGEQGRVSTRPR